MNADKTQVMQVLAVQLGPTAAKLGGRMVTQVVSGWPELRFVADLNGFPHQHCVNVYLGERPSVVMMNGRGRADGTYLVNGALTEEGTKMVVRHLQANLRRMKKLLKAKAEAEARAHVVAL